MLAIRCYGPVHVFRCSCVDRTAVNGVQELLIDYSYYNVTPTYPQLRELQQRCIEAGSWVRVSDGTPAPCRPTTSCDVGYGRSFGPLRRTFGPFHDLITLPPPRAPHTRPRHCLPMVLIGSCNPMLCSFNRLPICSYYARRLGSLDTILCGNISLTQQIRYLS